MAENNGDPEYKQSSFIPDSTSSDLVKEQRQWLENKRRQAGPSRSPEPREKSRPEITEQYRRYDSPDPDDLKRMIESYEEKMREDDTKKPEDYYRKIGYKPIDPEQRKVNKQGLDNVLRRRDSQDN